MKIKKLLEKESKNARKTKPKFMKKRKLGGFKNKPAFVKSGSDGETSPQKIVAAKGTKVNQNGNKEKKIKKAKKVAVTDKKPTVEETPIDDDFSDDLDDEEDDNEEMTGLTKDTLERLKQKDPDFFKFLQNNDKELLDLDDENEEDVEDILNDEVADEDDDDKEDSAADKESQITLNQVKQWRKVLQSQSSKAEELSAIKSIIKAFRRTVTQTTDSSEDFSPSSMSLLNPSLFNAIINTVLIDLLPAVMRFLRLQNSLKPINDQEHNDEETNDQGKESSDSAAQLGRGNFFDPRRSRNWKRIQSSMKIYLTDVLKMLAPLSADARASFERHILELTPFYNVFPHLIKRLIRRSIDEWCGLGGGTDDQSNRVLAYLVLHRTIRVLQSNDHLTVNERQSMVNQILRKLYMSYVAVARNTNESTIAQIGFMKNSLVELYRLDDQLAYQHAFIFIRQLAINLRSSFILKEKNSLKTVYNWQFTHSILLWTQLICSAHSQTDVLDPLISPLVMVISGTIKLLPTVKFLPLRFHLIRALIKLSAETGQFVPVLRYFIEIYVLFDPNKVQKANKGKNKKDKKDDKSKAAETDSTIKELEKAKKKGKPPAPKKSSTKTKAINFEVMLKVTKEQSTEIEFVEKVFDKFYTLCLQYMVSQSASIAFPEMVTIFLHQSRKFIQTIRMPSKRTSMKQLIDKIQENSNFIFQKRKTVRFSVLETASITAWEREIRQSESTPLAKFFKQYKTFKASNVSNKSKRSDAEADDTMDRRVQDKICTESKGRTFNVKSDLVKKQNKTNDEDEDSEMEMDDEDIDDELDDEELAQLDEYNDDEEDEDFDEDMEFDDEEEVELNAEQFAKVQKKIEKEEKKLKGKGKAVQPEKSTTGAEKRKKNKNKPNKKPRKLNNDLQLEGAFDLSSDDED